MGTGEGWSGARDWSLSTEVRAALGVWAPKSLRVLASGSLCLPCHGPAFPPGPQSCGSPGPDPVSSGDFLLSPAPHHSQSQSFPFPFPGARTLIQEATACHLPRAPRRPRPLQTASCRAATAPPHPRGRCCRGDRGQQSEQPARLRGRG